MTDRPMVVDIIHDHGLSPYDTLRIMAAIEHYGYVIVHPDDIPTETEQGSGSLYTNAYGRGWNKCRRHIFGETP